ncbi:GNAT family N-acetyltransferase [Bacillus solimangrovi]|uniref:N-acetyltransferase domain-containing protein n=1 Tax=Bacillus solimangrovi TaxID=1305675 RepID=A0A1E5LES5_9BACI|nr:GNAT family N-acetyltransferase [Bacillus solimangrovi]OEH92562.1 hypothetical protein BFG57_15225 [Bacillus solimangrovi]
MIIEINNKNKSEAEQILEIQIPSYKVEAELIQFDRIPRLFDTIQDLQECDETFYGYYVEGNLAGFISYMSMDESINICRMVVHPDHFNKGIASALLNHVLTTQKHAKSFIVQTGTANQPAVNLYEKHGFIEHKQDEIAEGIFLTQLIKYSN